MGGSFALYFNGNAVYTTSGGKRQRCFCLGETATQEKGRKGAGKGQETATQFSGAGKGQERGRKRQRSFSQRLWGKKGNGHAVFQHFTDVLSFLLTPPSITPP